MVSDHYYNEAKLMNELLESNPIKEERKELTVYLKPSIF
jgi:hypothetical protein